MWPLYRALVFKGAKYSVFSICRKRLCIHYFKNFWKLGCINAKQVNFFSKYSALYKRSNDSTWNNDGEEDDKIETEENEEEEQEYQEFVKRIFNVSDMGHQLLVIQPYIKWGKNKKRNTTPELQLAEAVALIDTLPNWKVVDKMTISLETFHKKTIFGKGNLEMLENKVKNDERITAVFISKNSLSSAQHNELQEIFHVPVFDRYMIVINIFREHARSVEAKLQVALAEIPYLRARVRGFEEGNSGSAGSRTASIGGSGETYKETRQNLIESREIKLKKAIKRVRNQRQMLRKNREGKDLPVVAVVGYTNAGKTALIKALTGETKLEPKNHLFATLDVTLHEGLLPSMMKVLYVDTVGFISDIPSLLIEAFVATLEDALLADVIIHVYDVSHPDVIAQVETVTSTLKTLTVKPELIDSVVTAANKIDKIKSNIEEVIMPEAIPVSAVKFIGLDNLKEEVEKAILSTTDRIKMTIKVPSGSGEAAWLYKQATVSDVFADVKDPQYLCMEVIITQENLSKFKHYFIKR